MYTNFALGTTAFLLCFVLTPLCRNLAIRFGLLDQPDTRRKLHAKPIPRLGGVAIVVSYALSLLLGAAASRRRVSASIFSIAS